MSDEWDTLKAEYGGKAGLRNDPVPVPGMTVARPLVRDEVWLAIEQPGASQSLPSIWCGQEEIAVIYEAEARVGHQNARARLASAAPDMARVLLEAEWGDRDSTEWGSWAVCFSCGGTKPDEPGHRDTGHKPDCGLDAALRKAGLR